MSNFHDAKSVCRHSILFVLLVFCGCSDSSRPSDLPTLFPCTFVVTQDGSPLEEAVVTFVVQAEVSQKYNPVAITDSEGKAVLSTYGFPGVPSGKYKVVIVKNIDDDFVYRIDDSGERVIVSSKSYRTIEKQFTSAETTPHEIEVTSKSKNIPITFEVGKAIKEKL